MAKPPPHDQNTWQFPHLKPAGPNQGACLCTLPCCLGKSGCICPECNDAGHCGPCAARSTDARARKGR